MQSIGVVSKTAVESYSLSGPVARSSGLLYDIRFNYPYEFFKYLNIGVLIGLQGII